MGSKRTEDLLDTQLGILALENAAKSKAGVGGALRDKGLHFVRKTTSPRMSKNSEGILEPLMPKERTTLK